MLRRRRGAVTLIALTVLVGLPALAAPAVAAGPRSEHDRIVAFWTRERIASARPREFVLQPGGRFAEPAAGPRQLPAAAPANTTGSPWPDGTGKAYRVVGRVLFTLGGSNWICSGAAATDPRGDISVVLTAAHCAYDQQRRAFATNWTFYPEFDANPTYSCSEAPHGCWTASRLVVHKGFAGQGSFNMTAIQHDWAFAVTGAGGADGGQLDALGSFPIAFRTYSTGTPITALGYPAGSPYDGQQLTYCSGPLQYDPWMLNRTYRLACDMTGGSSGGPWLTGFDANGETGTLSSVNSYIYSGLAAMHGPKFNSKTQATWNAAIGSGSGNTIVK